MDINNYIKNIFRIKGPDEFNDHAIQLFKYQYKCNNLYQKYINLLGYDVSKIKHYESIPFLPIDFFRTTKITTSQTNHQAVFFSSGSTNSMKSKHYVLNLEIYKESILSSFKLFFDHPNKFTILCMVPSFKENPNSSLAFMCNELIKKSQNEKSGFYLNKKNRLKNIILSCEKAKQKYILFGLSFELLQFAKESSIALENGIIIETGGTKKNQTRIIKETLHQQLKLHFKSANINSEYGMAELLSQSYCLDNQIFYSPPWKKVLIRDKTNPLKIINDNQRGCINIIDLANIYSCGFIATNDLGYSYNGGFNIIGRNQNSTQRGCNLMI
tara:strand:+ start:111 stop:1094 length:984 start_codon:yes stop_codon:yes gene_type:complete